MFVPTTENQKYSYTVRFINPDQKSKYITKIWHGIHEKFESVSALKQRACEDFEDKLYITEIENFECGYFEKSSKRWIEYDQDLEAIYQVFKGRDCEITLWFSVSKQTKKRKREREEQEDSVPSKRVSREEKVDTLAQELREKHADQFSGPQLRLWARMKLNGQHNSMDHPPQIPLFTGTINKPKRDSLTEALTSAATAVVGILKGTPQSSPAPVGMSPGKRARILGQHLDHLEKIKSLYESGVLSKSEFQEQKEYALSNIKEINKTS